MLEIRSLNALARGEREKMPGPTVSISSVAFVRPGNITVDVLTDSSAGD